VVTHWNRQPTTWTVPLIALTALLAVSAIVVHFLGQSNPELNATGGLRNILWFATFVVAFLTYFTARGGRRR
jgi:amino acid transporter